MVACTTAAGDITRCRYGPEIIYFRARIGTLEAEKLELEDRVKSLKKELDQIKKKAADDRSKAKKEKVRYTASLLFLQLFLYGVLMHLVDLFLHFPFLGTRCRASA